ncbi:hypothetical protein M4L90_14215 [Staphylococcus equorum]|uniref:Uncharacterized protein n=1 Tax=Staphylococcus equorum TaxID=246432 RepID=A0A9X4QZ86_9STAP|nr:hypothetical protein [Staphylococcus equorum]MDG0820931.1 hypothetical protein [Staphylococcus equorum]MDG0841686.1 hypothetical protein [Staphylococcus equorum]MDG0847256.1 hypothetical protein [Staphylococcus equorum]
MNARDMINELIDIIEMVGDVDIATEDGEDFEFEYHNWGSDYSAVELNIKE